MDYKTKQTSKEKQALYIKYKKTVNDLTLGGVNEYGPFKADPDVLNFIKWEQMDYREKNRCIAEWDRHYTEVKKTRAFANYKEKSDAMKVKDVENIVRLNQESIKLESEHLNGKFEILKPQCINPDDFLHKQNVTKYKNAKWNILMLEKESKDIENNGLGSIFL